MARTVILDHPLVAHHLTELRDQRTPPPEFRRLVQRLSGLLAYEATQDLALAPVSIETPVAPTTGHRIRQRIALLPILRAGLGMVDPILDLLPEAEVWHLGVYRDELTASPVEYYSKLPKDRPVDVAFVLDPMLATGGSAQVAVEALRRWGVPSIRMLSLIASRPGLEAVQRLGANVDVYVCTVDQVLNQRKFIVPGLGDAGDRSFNTLAGA